MSFLYNEGISPATYICTIQLTKQIKKMETLEKKAAEMLQKSEVVVLTSINQEGYPRPVPMSMVKAEGISTVWMSTGNDSIGRAHV